MKLYPFRENKNLCVCHRINLYLDKMKKFHEIEAQLLLSIKKALKVVTTQTYSRWVLEVLDLSRINTEVFISHSTRSGSTSKAKTSVVSSNNILKRVYWTQISTFGKF